MALTVWDQHLGTSRDATQEDIDILQAKVNAFGRLTTELTVLQTDLFREIGTIRERYKTSGLLSGDL